ncbi:MAG TPA: anti-sigma factor [Stellaceae bacterium]|jgi:anti-sigma factor RsiW
MTPADCDKVLLVQAEFDGELDAAEAAALALHREICPICRAAAAELAQTRELLQAPGMYHAAPDDLRARVLAKLGAAQAVSPPPAPGWFIRWRQGWAGFGLGAACAAALAFLIVVPRQQGLADQIVASHIRALQPGHLEDVVSTDQHTVKPWFDGRLDFAPPVKDLAGAGFPLKGGRLDYLDGRPVAALVYQRDKHLIDLYVWPENGTRNTPPSTTAENGYNVVHWSADGMTLWAVSDVEATQLADFASDWRKMK